MTSRRTLRLLAVAAALAVLAAACARTTYPNAPLARYDSEAGYRFDRLAPSEDDVFLILVLSGGGMRASALAYGALETLERTRYRADGEERSLLDEVDLVSSVSGGSVPAAYYALRGKTIFEDFLDGFLYQDILGELAVALMSPVTWVRLASPEFSRIDILAEIFDRRLFEGATYADLTAQERRPFLVLNAADMSSGAVFPFTQEEFDALCSDLESVPLATAVAASAAFPLALTPVTLKIYSGDPCPAEIPEPRWIAQGLQDKYANLARLKRARLAMARRWLPGADETQDFVHLLDGGVSDNVGLRGPLLLMSSTDRQPSLLAMMNMGLLKRIAVIVVNARSDPDNLIDHEGATPGLLDMARSVTSVPIDTVTAGSQTQLDELFGEIERAKREYRGCDRLLREACNARMPTPFPLLDVETYRIEVDFDLVDDPDRRRRLKNIPTTWTLKKDEVDELRAVACEILRESPGYQKLLDDLQARLSGTCAIAAQ